MLSLPVAGKGGSLQRQAAGRAREPDTGDRFDRLLPGRCKSWPRCRRVAATIRCIMVYALWCRPMRSVCYAWTDMWPLCCGYHDSAHHRDGTVCVMSVHSVGIVCATSAQSGRTACASVQSSAHGSAQSAAATMAPSPQGSMAQTIALACQ